MNTERRSKTRRGILLIILLLCLVAIIGGTYARYSSDNSVTATAGVASWAVQLNDTDITGEEKTIPVTFTVTGSTDVATDKIAPSVTATATIELDLTGTEVGVDVTAVPDLSGITFASKDKISATAKIGETSVKDGTPLNIPLVNNAAFTADNGVKNIDLTLTWENDDTNNADDTTSSATETLTVPVLVTVTQHIAAN